MYVDLHIHTKSSDGTWDVDELLANIQQANITTFSITDHDTIENSLLMAQTIEDNGLNFLIGAEVSCSIGTSLYHITTYGFDPHNQAFLHLLDTNRRIIETYNDTTIQALEHCRSDVSYAAYEAYQHDRARGGWKALNFLLDEGVVADIREYFHIMGKLLDCSLVFHEPEQVLQTIKNAGGIPFLAHPNVYCQGQKMPDEAILPWVNLGIAGIECYSSSCSMQDARAYTAFCRKHGLLISGGSDCHGTFILSRTLGEPRITPEMLDLGNL